jgi:ATP-dependent Clp protease adaptor protein ClpS
MEPRLQQVLIFNDDHTSMEFVVNLLEELFGKSRDEAIRIMLKAHQEGHASCGAYAADEARRLADAGAARAAQAGFPLRVDVVEAEGG